MNPNEIWQVEVNNQIYETEFIELTRWIADGSLLRADKVRRGNLRWLEAGKVPSLNGFFNAKDLGIEPPELPISVGDSENSSETFTAQTENFPATQHFSENQTPFPNSSDFPSAVHTENFVSPASEVFDENADRCVLHPENEAAFLCDTCCNRFCASCPKSFGGSVKICPMCGAMCQRLEEAVKKREFRAGQALTEGFGFADFGNALAFPFRYKSSLIIGAIMFMFFSLGQSAASVGGIFLIASAIICAMLANMLTFGVLANTVENFSQGNLDSNFMPDFDDFSLWDDVIHPFFLSIGVYISSFGPLILVVALAVYLMLGAITSTVSEMPGEAVKPNPPLILDEAKITQQSEEVKKLLENTRPSDPNKIYTAPETINQNSQIVDAEEKEIQELQEMIQQSRKAQMESVIGKSPETDEAAETQMMLTNFLNLAAPMLLLAFLAMLWGAFYFPAACAVAGYTRSFIATLNPLVGLDTIRHLGFDYVKILFMGFLILVISGVIGGIFAVILSPFDMPKMGNLAAKAIGSWVTFYFTIVFSCLLGYALYKNSDKLKLYRG